MVFKRPDVYMRLKNRYFGRKREINLEGFEPPVRESKMGVQTFCKASKR